MLGNKTGCEDAERKALRNGFVSDGYCTVSALKIAGLKTSHYKEGTIEPREKRDGPAGRHP
jgi:hypothetical protein